LPAVYCGHPAAIHGTCLVPAGNPVLRYRHRSPGWANPGTSL